MVVDIKGGQHMISCGDGGIIRRKMNRRFLMMKTFPHLVRRSFVERTMIVWIGSVDEFATQATPRRGS